ncbi:hypothetical protein JXC34_03035 [Candidatus Woesearchaeota archaeon]|nr:hypothetical protein [Candidatus Woesearchaeota archaeon]
MEQEFIQELENLILGKIESMEIDVSASPSRESILEALNKIISYALPGSWAVGEFVSNDDTDYLVYDVHFCGAFSLPSSIRFFEFANKFTLTRV